MTKQLRKQRGFSLIEMSMLVIIISMVAVITVESNTVSSFFQKIDQTDERLNAITQAIQEYYDQQKAIAGGDYGFLPCPADGQLNPSDATFGTSTDCNAAAENSGTVGYFDPDLPTSHQFNLVSDQIRVGTIPTRTLGLSDEYMYDEWGNRFTYAVIKDLAVDAARFGTYATDVIETNPRSNSVIIVKNDMDHADIESLTDHNVTNSNTIVGYFLMSHGPDRHGAYTKAGSDANNRTECPARDFGADTLNDELRSSFDVYNCDYQGDDDYSSNEDTISPYVFLDMPANKDSEAYQTYFYDLVRWNTIGGIHLGTSPEGSSGSCTQNCGVTNIEVPTINFTPNFTKIDAQWQICAIDNADDVYCWGAGSNRENASSTAGTLHVPAQVAGISDVAGISAGVRHTCATKHDNTIWCWGEDRSDTFGDGMNANYTTHIPTQATLIKDIVKQLEAGDDLNCYVRYDDSVHCWGDGSSGKRGDGITGTEFGAQAVIGMTDVDHISVGNYHSLALKQDGTVWCWGLGSFGECGDNNFTGTNATPVQVLDSDGVSPLSNVKQVFAGGHYGCALKNDGTLYCWGRNSNALGQGAAPGDLGYARQVRDSTGTGYLTGIDRIIPRAGDSSFSAFANDGKVWTWGDTYRGTAFDGIQTWYNLPVEGTLLNFTPTDIVHLTFSAVAVRSDGCMFSIGRDLYGGLGNDSVDSGTIANPLQNVIWPDCGHATMISRNVAGTLYVLHNTGRLYGMGQNDYGQMAQGYTGPTVTVLSEVSGNHTDWIYVNTDANIACGIRGSSGSGTLWCWGQNDNGELGIASAGASSDVPVQVRNDTDTGYWSDWVSVDTDADHTCGLRATGQIYCWGDDWRSRVIPNGTSGPDYLYPVDVSGGYTDWMKIAIGPQHTCAIRDTSGSGNGRLYCWGSDEFGQIGNGGAIVATEYHGLQDISATTGITDWVNVGSNHRHTCAVRATGQMYCWGYHENGALGDGDGTISRSSPNLVRDDTGLGSWSDWDPNMSFSERTTCARRTNGTIWCFGNNTFGQIGNNTTTHSSLPREVSGGHTDWTNSSQQCGIRNGVAYCWGRNDYGEVGSTAIPVGTDSLIPRVVNNY